MKRPAAAREYVEQVLKDLLVSHGQLMKGVDHIVVDYELVNRAPLQARKLIEDIRLGEIRIDRWQPPEDDELEDI